MRGAAYDSASRIQVRDGKTHETARVVQMLDYIVRVNQVKLAKVQGCGIVITRSVDNIQFRMMFAHRIEFGLHRLNAYISDSLTRKYGSELAAARSNFQDRRWRELQNFGSHAPMDNLGVLLGMARQSR
jgi:hypothetical protein